MVSLPETLYLSYKGEGQALVRKNVTTRPSNLVAYWPMDEGTGQQTMDALGRFSGTLNGGASWKEGYFGKGIQFNGLDAYVLTQATGDLLDIDGKKPRTISFWVKVDGNNPKSEPGFYGYGENSSFNNTYKFWGIRNIKESSYTRMRSDHSGLNWRSSQFDSLLGRWTHIAHCFNEAEVSLYMDGS